MANPIERIKNYKLWNDCRLNSEEVHLDFYFKTNYFTKTKLTNQKIKKWHHLYG
jgi:hypothetical protein